MYSLTRQKTGEILGFLHQTKAQLFKTNDVVS